MSATGCCYDNAITEFFFHTLKIEVVYQYRYVTRAEAKLRIFEYIESCYNRFRMHTSIDGMTPERFEQQLTKVG